MKKIPTSLEELRVTTKQHFLFAIERMELESVTALVKSYFGTFQGTSAMLEGSVLEPSMRNSVQNEAVKLGNEFKIKGMSRANPFAVTTRILDLPMIQRKDQAY